MPTKVEVGAIGQNVARVVATERAHQGLSLQDVADAMTAAGRPISRTGVHRIETGLRRVDADDLEALERVFKITAHTLMRGGAVQLYETDDQEKFARKALQWIAAAERAGVDLGSLLTLKELNDQATDLHRRQQERAAKDPIYRAKLARQARDFNRALGE